MAVSAVWRLAYFLLVIFDLGDSDWTDRNVLTPAIFVPDSVVTRSGIVLKLLPLSNAEAASAEASKYLRISGYRIVTREA
jgi:hypothetical protein